MSGFNENKQPLVIGIAGGSGSGKTTLSQALADVVGRDNVTFIPHDNYYKDISHLSLSERALTNFDHPDALDTDLLVSHIRQLKRCEEVRIPTYDFGTHSRCSEWLLLQHRPIIVLDGILIFSNEELVKEMDIKIFVDAPDDVRVLRRLSRDINERKRTVECVTRQYLTTVKPMHDEFVRPSMKHADIIVQDSRNAVAVDIIATRVRMALEQS